MYTIITLLIITYYYYCYYYYLNIIGITNLSRNTILAASLHPACAFTFATSAFSEYEVGM